MSEKASYYVERSFFSILNAIHNWSHLQCVHCFWDTLYFLYLGQLHQPNAYFHSFRTFVCAHI